MSVTQYRIEYKLVNVKRTRWKSFYRRWKSFVAEEEAIGSFSTQTSIVTTNVPKDMDFMKKLAERETLAEEIITDKQLLIDYDRKRNGNREALGKLRRSEVFKNEKKAWINFGDMFIRLPKDSTIHLIEQDQANLTTEINTIHVSMKSKAQQLEDLEGRDGSRVRQFEMQSVRPGELSRIADGSGRVQERNIEYIE